MSAPTVLLLAGTAEARAVAARLAARLDWRAVASVAGATNAPRPLPCETRVGGFGGVAGLADWLRAKGCAAILDATHPFATEITRNAVAAARATRTPYLRIDRPAWSPPPDVDWLDVATHEEAAALLPPRARALLTTGSKTLAPYAARRDVWWAVRAIDLDAVSAAGFGNGCAIAARPPFLLDAELDVMRFHRITHLVTKNAGGVAARPKLDAAAQLGAPVIVIRRPAPPAGADVAQSVDAAMDWLEEILR